jgi:hypothetical protein
VDVAEGEPKPISKTASAKDESVRQSKTSTNSKKEKEEEKKKEPEKTKAELEKEMKEKIINSGDDAIDDTMMAYISVTKVK